MADPFYWYSTTKWSFVRKRYQTHNVFISFCNSKLQFATLHWSEPLSLTNPLWKGLITDEAVLEHLALQILCEKVRLGTGAALKHFPSPILYEKARFQSGADLSWLDLLLYVFVWELFWSTFPYKCFMKRLDYSLEMVRSTFPYKSFMKSAIRCDYTAGIS